MVGEIEDQFTDGGTYRPAPGYRFVTVVFAFENAGTDEIEAANTVGNVFVLATRDGRAWQPCRPDGGMHRGLVEPRDGRQGRRPGD